ncbi:hypothetical protein QBC33DRAFT_598086 [Phialemonium atrogriseum]|uniref:Uncharacterized protein n=1 Tax=Phialemonium atrogriseum TaxID=1093897 RepID=A0AAJ0FIQ0_9PEZI|nr:uncharacterized protein QBC33DRAFT_598086 [Phialemonium atrogriseum]KAK1763559.1 hypothetical protein QBC33DRAFT_598086 [Phialemonium atrogriseum]
MSHYTQQETKRHEGRSHSRGRSSRHSSGSSRSLFSGCFSADDSDGSSGSGNLKVSLGIFSWMLLGLGLTRPRPKEYRRMQKYGADAKPKKHHSHRRGGKERLARNEAPRNGRVYEYERREGSRQAHRERRQVIDKSIAPHGPRPVPQYQPSQRSRNERQVSPEQIDEDMLADLLRPEWKSPTTSPLPPSFTSRSGRSSGDHRGHSRPSERRSHSENLYHLTLTEDLVPKANNDHHSQRSNSHQVPLQRRVSGAAIANNTKGPGWVSTASRASNRTGLQGLPSAYRPQTHR